MCAATSDEVVIARRSFSLNGALKQWQYRPLNGQSGHIMKRIAFLLPEQFYASSVAAVVDLLHIANGCLGREQPPLFAWGLYGERGEAVVSASGLAFAVDGDYADVGDVAAIYVPGTGYRDLPDFERRLYAADRFAQRLKEWHAEGRVLAANCTGVAWLAASGLLDGREATISWWLVPWLRARFPAIRLQANALLVDSGDLLTSGAASAHHRLALRLIERLAGADIARQCARLALIDVHRNSQAPYADFAHYLGHGDELVVRAQHWLQESLSRPLRLSDLAAALAASERTLMRRFRRALGDTPLHYLQQLRLNSARRLLETTSMGVKEIVVAVGYGDESTFRRLFKRELGCTPGDYRRASSSSAAPGARLATQR